MLFFAAAAMVLSGLVAPAAASADSYNGQAQTPPMGWNSWNSYGCAINEDLIKQTADAMVSNGMQATGYNYLVIDDCWMAKTRGADGVLQADPTTFPGGMKAIGDYLHARGLKFGIYQSPTEKTCQKRPGSYGYESLDAQTFASWGVDFLKYDWCQTDKDQSPTMWADNPNLTEKQLAQKLFTRMSVALKQTNRPITYSLSACCSALDFEKWAGSVANLWRTSTDINATWSSVLYNYRQAVDKYAAAGPGHWNDPDMLEVGVRKSDGTGGLSGTEAQSHFSLWSMMAAPLIAGNKLQSATAADLSILNNPDVIAVDQDSLGEAARVVNQDSAGKQTLSRKLANGDVAVALFNPTDSAALMTADLKNSSSRDCSGGCKARDLWSKAETPTVGTVSAMVPSRGVAMYRVSGGVAVPGATSVSLVGAASQRCLSTTGQNNGATTEIADCTGSQRWASSASGELKLSSNGKCLDLFDRKTAPGSTVGLWNCNGGDNQKWTLKDDGSIVSKSSGLCLDVMNGATAAGSAVRVWTCAGNPNQQWRQR